MWTVHEDYQNFIKLDNRVEAAFINSENKIQYGRPIDLNTHKTHLPHNTLCGISVVSERPVILSSIQFGICRGKTVITLKQPKKIRLPHFQHQFQEIYYLHGEVD